MDGYIYLIYEREFRISGWPLYKIGRTRDPIARMNGYSKQSIMVYLQMCTDHIIVEKNLIEIFKTKFIKHPKYGNEYFEGFNSCSFFLFFTINYYTKAKR